MTLLVKYAASKLFYSLFLSPPRWPFPYPYNEMHLPAEVFWRGFTLKGGMDSRSMQAMLLNKPKQRSMDSKYPGQVCGNQGKGLGEL